MAVENKRRILIVEDEKDMQDVMRLLLERMGYEIISAYDVATAVQILRGKPLPVRDRVRVGRPADRRLVLAGEPL